MLSLLSRIERRLILLDVQMPDMDGFETCRHIRKDSRLARVPIGFLTALKRPADVRAGMAAGGNDFILKPFNPAILLSRVNHWTSQRLTKIYARQRHPRAIDNCVSLKIMAASPRSD